MVMGNAESVLPLIWVPVTAASGSPAATALCDKSASTPAPRAVPVSTFDNPRLLIDDKGRCVVIGAPMDDIPKKHDGREPGEGRVGLTFVMPQHRCEARPAAPTHALGPGPPFLQRTWRHRHAPEWRPESLRRVRRTRSRCWRRYKRCEIPEQSAVGSPR